MRIFLHVPFPAVRWYGSLVFPVHLLELPPSPMAPFEVSPADIREAEASRRPA
jgi:hypothetical protein